MFVHYAVRRDVMRICKRCGTFINGSWYDTGYEEFCGCQNSLMVEFDESLWVNVCFNCDGMKMIRIEGYDEFCYVCNGKGYIG